ncbi:hypothetical protein [Saccharicrinis sp. GN24d3]|uniref:hypothetical protein n=1 Tax=Saccharicrinis sp. GN24d3 TaxID=3458416 RepID=UPI0040369AAE
MKRAKFFTSILFVLIFVFPSIYQATHVVQHHWQAPIESHCCEQHHCKYNDFNSFNNPVETKKACPVCEFEFASFNKAAKIELVGVANYYMELVNNEIQEFVYCNSHQTIKHRGPPLFILT